MILFHFEWLLYLIHSDIIIYLLFCWTNAYEYLRFSLFSLVCIICIMPFVVSSITITTSSSEEEMSFSVFLIIMDLTRITYFLKVTFHYLKDIKNFYFPHILLQLSQWISHSCKISWRASSHQCVPHEHFRSTGSRTFGVTSACRKAWQGRRTWGQGALWV